LNIELDQKRSIRSYKPSAFLLWRPHASPYPIVDLTVSDWVVDAIARTPRCGKSFVTNEEVEILSAAFARKMSARSSSTGQIRRLVGDRWASGARRTATARWASGSYRRGKDEGWGVVAGET